MTRRRLCPSLVIAAALVATLLAMSLADAADFSVVDYGAVGDGETLNTESIQQAIDQAAAAGGGRLVVPAGVFKSGSIFLKQGVELHLAEGAVLLGSTDIADYPKRMTRIEGHFEPWLPALVNATDVDQLQISGDGTLDGNGKPFWVAFWKRRAENPQCTNLEVERPRLVFLQNCNNARISGVRLQNSGFWNLHLYHCRSVEIDGISITAPHGDRPEIIDVETPWDEISVDRAPSSDGIDIDSCQSVTIRNSRISVGDDCIALKGTKGPTALEDESSPPVENILVEDCVFANGHGVLTCGSEATIIRNVQVRRCQVGAGIPLVRLKLRPDTPQLYENFLVEEVELGDAQALFDVKPWTQFFDLQGHDPPASRVRNIVVKNISGSLQSLGELRGNEGDTIENIVLQEIDVDARAARFSVGDVQRLVLSNVQVNGEAFDVE